MCVATLWLTAADSVQDLHLIPFSLQPKLQHQWILLQSYNKWAEKQQACLIVFPECRRNLSKVTTNEAETEKKTPIFFPGYAECSHNLSKVTTNERKNNKLAWLFFPSAVITYQKLVQAEWNVQKKSVFLCMPSLGLSFFVVNNFQMWMMFPIFAFK